MKGVCITWSSIDYTVYCNSYSILNINYPHVTHIRLLWMFMAVPLCPRTTLNIQGSPWHGHPLALAPRSLKSCYHGDMLPWRHPGKFQGCPGMVKPGWTSVWVCVCYWHVVAVMWFEGDSKWQCVCNAMIKRKVGMCVTDNNAFMYTISSSSERHHKV